MNNNPFKAGAVVYFRVLDHTNTLARSVHLNARNVAIKYREVNNDDYVILDDKEQILGIYPRDWVACILPLETTGPANVVSEQTRHSNPTKAEEGDSEGIAERAKRFNS